MSRAEICDAVVTQFGFEWEAAKVERITDLPNGAVVIGIGMVGNKGSVVDIYVSPTGRRIRVFRGGKELR